MAANPTMPVYGQECKSGYIVWDGLAQIPADNGQKIVVVEVDEGNKCIGAGSAVIVSRL